jgi:hypothetical protein
LILAQKSGYGLSDALGTLACVAALQGCNPAQRTRD